MMATANSSSLAIPLGQVKARAGPGSVPFFERTLTERTALPHPDPLPLGEGESFAVSAKDLRWNSRVSPLANLHAHDRSSLSQRERARVRESCPAGKIG